MKIIYHALFILCMLACKEDEVFDIYNYDGAYPKNVDGTIIKTYIPEILGGEVEVNFNGHNWNHSPIIFLNATAIKSSVESEEVIDVSLHALMTNVENDACGLESIFFRVPLKAGKIHLDEHNKDYAFANFLSVNCDATKDNYKLNRDKSNWINILKFDSVTRELIAEFDLYFLINDRNSDFGPIYPGTVHLEGKIKTISKRL